MGTKKIAVLASAALLLVSGWMPMVIGATLTIGAAATITGCAGKSDTRQDTRTEQRTEERMENRRD